MDNKVVSYIIKYKNKENVLKKRLKNFIRGEVRNLCCVHI